MTMQQLVRAQARARLKRNAAPWWVYLPILLVIFGTHALFAQSYVSAKTPRFAQFPAKRLTDARHVEVQNPYELTGLNLADMRSALRQAPNFAGHFTFFHSSCGTSCASDFIVDRISGRMWNPDHDERGVAFRADSRLLIIDPPDPPETYADKTNVSDTLPVRYFVWEGDHLRLVFTKLCWIVAQHQVCGRRAKPNPTDR